jgi:hypothetical protein
MPALAATSEKSRRRQQMQNELVKAPLRFQNSLLSSLCERAGGRTQSLDKSSGLVPVRYSTCDAAPYEKSCGRGAEVRAYG